MKRVRLQSRKPASSPRQMSLKEQLAHANEQGRVQIEQAKKAIAEFEDSLRQFNEVCMKRCDELQQLEPAQGELPAHLEIKLGKLHVQCERWDLIETKAPLPPQQRPKVDSESERIVRKPPAPRPIANAPNICLMCKVPKAAECLLVLPCTHRFCEECIGHHLAKLVSSCQSQDLLCPHLRCSEPLDDIVLRRCLSEREFISIKRLRFHGQVPYKSPENRDLEERKADVAFRTEQATFRSSVPAPRRILDLEPHKPDAANLIERVVPPAHPRSFPNLEETKVLPHLPDSTVPAKPAFSGLAAPTSAKCPPDSPAKRVSDLGASSMLDKPYNELSDESTSFNNIDLHGYTCSCSAPQPETLLCKHEVCNCCFKLYVIQQIPSGHLNITSFKCPTCSSRISEDKLYWIFGGQDIFESLFLDATEDAEFICTMIRDNGLEQLSKSCPRCSDSKVNTLQTDFVTCLCGSSFCWVCGERTGFSDQDHHSCE
jgi:hypothetical protein